MCWEKSVIERRMRMNDIRAEWLATIQRYQFSPDRPDNDQFWCTRLDTASQDELHTIQSEKLRVAVRYAYECIPFYRRKFDRIRLSPAIFARWMICRSFR